MKMDKKYYTTKLGQIESAFRKGNPLVVFLNSFGSFDTAQSFSKIIDELPAEDGIFAPDYLNTGFSGKSTVSYTITAEADELAKMINGFNAEQVIIVAHSIGGVYAFQMQAKVKNLRALILLEPTTREIILNPPREQGYLDQEKQEHNAEQFIHDQIFSLFSEKEATTFWQTTAENADQFDDHANQNAISAMKNDHFWQSTTRMSDDIPVIIFTEAYRQKEYERSEYNNQKAKIIPLGTFHYIQWEYPEEIAQEIISAIVD